MNAPDNVDIFIAEAPELWRPTLIAMREFLLTTDLEESIKWMFPVYSFGKKNVIGLIHTKSYAGAWFFQGALLDDPEGILINAKEDVTVAQRQLRFTTPAEVDLDLFRAFSHEAIQNQRDGLEILPQKKGEVVIPDLLQNELNADAHLQLAFGQFTPYKQREFCNYITGAKRETTKLSRLQKILPMIKAGMGLSDKYR